MSAEVVSNTIQLILAPVVMLSACALLLNGMLSRYAAINDRMRSMVRERLDLLPEIRAEPVDDLAAARVKHLDSQIGDLMHRHKLEHNAILIVYCAILVFVICILFLALAAITDTRWVAVVALLIFLLGTFLVALSVGITIEEVRTSRRSVSYEVKEIFGL
jgi:hypothetical protein